MALISLDDLEGLDDDITDDPSDDITEEQPMAEDRLLSHWQRVGATHQVSVPADDVVLMAPSNPDLQQALGRFEPSAGGTICVARERLGVRQEELEEVSGVREVWESLLSRNRWNSGSPHFRICSTVFVSEMTGPIHEMTQNSQQRETLPYAQVSSHEKMGALQYEERVYPAGRWACVTRADGLYEQSVSMAFMKLMRFICKENSLGKYLGMTVPVVSLIHMTEDGSGFQKQILTGFFLPSQYQSCPPDPLDPEIQIQDWDPISVIARPFFGTTNEATVGRQISVLWEVLAESEGVRRDRYMIAVFENPGVPQRRNEIWFLRQRL